MRILVTLLLVVFFGTVARGATCTPPCNDGNACTTDACDPDLLQCVYTPVDCNDNNPCTTDSCDPASGCQHAPGPDGAACNDGSTQTCNDHCQAGTCVGSPCSSCALDCDDGNACTIDTCVQGLGCEHSPQPDGWACDDHNPQTCFDHCQAGSCVSRSCSCPPGCDDGNPCTDDDCDSQGACLHTPKDCDDQNQCTQDSCDVSSGQCRHDPQELAGCVTGSCLFGECLGGSCFPTQPPTGGACNDHNPCTVDSCDAVKGCVFVPLDKDVDNDAHVDAACGGDDCNDGDAGAWRVVSEVANVQAASTTPTPITWDSQASSAGPATIYDGASGVIPSPGAGFQSPACLSTGTATFYDDRRTAPPLNQLYWYLVRARNSCGTGDYGKASNGVPRPIAVCP